MKADEHFLRCQSCQKGLIKLVISDDTIAKSKLRVKCSCGDYVDKTVVGGFAWHPFEAPIVDIVEEDGYIIVETI